MSTLTIGRIQLAPPLQWYEAIGDPVTTLGGSVVPAPRQAPRHQVSISTLAADGAADTVAARLAIRRALRALLNNSDLKLQGFVYIVYSDDPELNGWYLPDFGQLNDLEGSSGISTGVWKLENINWMNAGHMRTHQEARNVWMRDLRGGTAWRDFRRLIYSTDFSWLPALQLSVLPNGVVSPALTVSGLVIPSTLLPVGRDGGVCHQVAGLNDLATVAYDRPESALNLSDVIVYDRRGAGDVPTAGPGATWEDAPGTDYPWNWAQGGGPADMPVIDNQLVRVRYDATVGHPGFCVDVWNGTAYVERGKMVVQRFGDSNSTDDTWISSTLMEYTPERTTVKCILASSSDLQSREQVYITMQRGELGLIFECYPALKAAGTQADARLVWTPALTANNPDLNISMMKVDSQGTGSWTAGAAGTAVLAATAGTGAGVGQSGVWPSGATDLGASNFSNSENWVGVLRCVTAYNAVDPYQLSIIVQQAANAKVAYSGNNAQAYGIATNSIVIAGQNGAGYVQAQLYFSPTQSQQVMEAEAMTLGSGTTATGDAGASGTSTTATTRSGDGIHVSQANWPNSVLATYRVFARVKVSAGTGHVYAKTGSTTGTTVNITSTSYIWLDLGEIVGNNSTLEIHGWISGGTLSVDRIESYLVQDRARSTAIYSGSRDLAQAALMDNRLFGAVVSR